jgi:hypothetical protein
MIILTAWYQRLNTYLKSNNFSRIKVDCNICIKMYYEGHFIILYVHDCIVVRKLSMPLFDLKD